MKMSHSLNRAKGTSVKGLASMMGQKYKGSEQHETDNKHEWKCKLQTIE